MRRCTGPKIPVSGTGNTRYIRIYMDGKGCWRDSVFVERLWKTIKYEEICLRADESVSEARVRFTKYIDFYHQLR